MLGVRNCHSYDHLHFIHNLLILHLIVLLFF
nr:MAG TPA: hypothetical protein [Caudoviricetes sp.]DAY53127.1 MAG TPA: hypothetical protein [Caudoviricetes sp.]